MTEVEELPTDRLLLRAPRPGDRAGLEALFEAPGVQRWWGDQSDDEIERRLRADDNDVTVLVIERTDQAAGGIIGLIQFHEEDDPMYRHAGIDVAIHDDHQRQGLGPEAIEAVVKHLAHRGHHRVVIDPNAANRSAIEAYRRVGFRPVGVMRQYEWSETEQRWSDGLLMELLMSEWSQDSPPPVES